MSGCNAVRSITVNGCNAVRGMKMHEVSYCKEYDKDHYGVYPKLSYAHAWTSVNFRICSLFTQKSIYKDCQL